MDKSGFCTYRNSITDTPCSLPVWESSPESYCIGHTRNPQKNKRRFHETIQEKIRRQDYHFGNFFFPFHFQLKNAVIRQPVSWIGCEFQEGMLFQHIQFEGAINSFERCISKGAYVIFDQCEFGGLETRFDGSRFEGQLILFNRCRFRSTTTRFENLEWNARQRIAFHHCRFTGDETLFSCIGWNAPEIGFHSCHFAGGAFSFRKAEVTAHQFTWREARQTQGTLSLEDSRFVCSTWELGHSQWDGAGLWIRSCAWFGERLQADHQQGKAPVRWDSCRLMGTTLDFSHFEGRDFSLCGSQISGKKLITFSRSRYEHRFSMRHNHLDGEQIHFDFIESRGEEFSLQGSELKADRWLAEQVNLTARRTSFTRSRILARTCNFSGSLFQSLHTSLQGMEIKATNLLFQNVRFLSSRTAFNRSRFEAQIISFEGSDFGSGHTSFWNTRFAGGEVSWRFCKDQMGWLRFETDLSQARFEGSHFSHCTFGNSVWKQVGFSKRPTLLDETALVGKSNIAELQRLYRWIAAQYGKESRTSRQKQFLRAAQTVERYRRSAQGNRWSKHKGELQRRLAGWYEKPSGSWNR